YVAELLLAQFLDGFIQDLVVRLEPDVIDEAALLSPEQVAGSPDIHVPHRQIESAAQIAELLHRLKALPGLAREPVDGRDEQIAERLSVRAPDAPAKLMKLRQSEAVRAVDDDGVGVRDVEPVLDDVRADEYVKPAFDEIQHHLLQIGGFHLPVSRSDAHVRHDESQHRGDLVDGLHPIVDEENLASAADFVQDGVADEVLVEGVDLRFDGLPVRRRRGDDGQIARAQQRELERPRDGSSGEGERVDLRAQLPEALFGGDPETLLFVDDE